MTLSGLMGMYCAIKIDRVQWMPNYEWQDKVILFTFQHMLAITFIQMVYGCCGMCSGIGVLRGKTWGIVLCKYITIVGIAAISIIVGIIVITGISEIYQHGWSGMVIIGGIICLMAISLYIAPLIWVAKQLYNTSRDKC